MTTRQEMEELGNLVRMLESADDTSSIEISSKIALKALRSLVKAEGLFESEYYSANASYGTNNVEGKAQGYKKDKQDCSLVIKELRETLLKLKD